MTRGAPACEGLLVLDFGQGMAGSMPGMILADNGADVIKVEPPWGDSARSEPGFLMWNRGKRGITLDLRQDEDRSRAVELAGSADVVIESFRPGVAERLGIGYAELAADNSELVYCSISGFGPAHSYDDVAGYEGLIAAISGRMVGLDHLSGAIDHQDRDAPIFNVVPIASYGAAQLATQGILAALLERDRSHRGDHLSTSLVQGLSAFLMRQELARSTDDSTVEPAIVSDAMQRGIELCFMTAECQDGRFLQMCARQDKHFHDWLEAIGLARLLDDPRFNRGPLAIPTVDDVSVIDAEIRTNMLTRTVDEWMHVFSEEFDIGADPFLTPDEFLSHPQMTANDRIVEIDDPTVGSCTQVGPIALFSETPSAIGSHAPALGEHNAELLTDLPQGSGQANNLEAPTERSADQATANSTLPLEGVTVVEVAYYIAGPLAGALLAEMGARVIKVEPIDGDPYRRTGLQAAKFLHGKESIALDLKQPEGTQALHDLVRTADIFVHSFRPGVPERLHIDRETLLTLNPGLVYIYAGSYGSEGPQASRTAFHSTPNALVGSGILQAGAGNPPVDDSYPDSGSALGVATAMLLGLHARRRNGQGEYVETTMLASTGYIMSPYLVRYEGRQELPSPDSGQHGLHALCRLYPSEDGWVFISAPTDRDWGLLTNALGHPEWRDDERFVDASARLSHDDHLVTLLSAELLGTSARSWADRARAHKAPLVAVNDQPQEDWFEAEKLLLEAAHPAFGSYWRPPVKIEFERMSSRLGPAAAIGEHSRALLGEIGYPADRIEQLVSEGVVGTWS
jgi:crotonobetainyl-CoA:carnitine CoA-transferase CaiB-like acyl-CoA transferase